MNLNLQPAEAKTKSLKERDPPKATGGSWAMVAPVPIPRGLEELQLTLTSTCSAVRPSLPPAERWALLLLSPFY